MGTGIFADEGIVGTVCTRLLAIAFGSQLVALITGSTYPAPDCGGLAGLISFEFGLPSLATSLKIIVVVGSRVGLDD